MGKAQFYMLTVYAVCFIVFGLFAPHNIVKQTKLQDHPSHVFPKVFEDDKFQNLVNLAKNTTFLMTSRADAQVEFDYGSSPLGENGKCDHMLQHPNIKGDKCIIPARLDVGKHLLMTGGWGSKKESYEKIVSRGRFFQNFWADFNPEFPEIMPEVSELLEQPNYQVEAKKICQDQQYLDPMQASILVALPGQEVAMHYDTPWFYGADRNVFPLWLLASMRQSGLYNDKTINQVQGVAYLHEWTNAETMGGGFYFYDKGPGGPMTLVEAQPNRGLIVDGTVMAHGTQTFIPGGKSDLLDKNLDYQIKFNDKTRTWDVSELESKKFFKSYGENEIRITLVWRQRCFDDKNDFNNFKQKNEKSKQLNMGEVIDNLLSNLVSEGKISQKPVDEIEIIQTITKHYITYPYPETAFPYNYCMLMKLAPFTQSLLERFC